MPYLTLKIVSGSETGQNDTYSFTHFGGSIGRSEECEWTLIDSDRFVSKKHLVISFTNQQFILTDVSSNGVIVNNSGVALGRGNEHIIQATDTLIIGKHIVQVEDMSLETEQVTPVQQPQSDDDLLGLVMGADASQDPIATPAPAPHDIFNIPDNLNSFNEPKPESDLGLEDILSQPIKTPVPSEFSATNEPANPFDLSPQSTPSFSAPTPSAPLGTQANAIDSLIPDDWELFDTAPKTNAFEPNKENNNSPTPFDNSAQIEPMAPAMPSQETSESPTNIAPPIFKQEPIQQVAEAAVEVETPQAFIPPTHQAAPEAPINTQQEAIKPTLSNTTNDDFFGALYEKLGLSKEFKANIDREAFAEDIATILLSTTQGLMSLLASRTAFKQESRLSSTLIQPRSNNPIKFSIDPVDTLEMLLVKKKKGYMSVEDSYNEAMEDIQLHQMAFMSGLQGTLNGVLGQLDPQEIEQQVNKTSKKFMGLNSNSQCWQIYKEKQPLLAKSVKENLNEVLGNYFSDAYQSQINSFKKDK